jgi:hypothetical protein
VPVSPAKAFDAKIAKRRVLSITRNFITKTLEH